MGHTRCAFVLSLALAAAVHAQPPPDFAGTWQLDLTRSDLAAYTDAPGPVTVTIMQTPQQIHIVTKTSRGTTEETYQVGGPDVAAAARPPVARWQGEALRTDAVRDIRGQSVTVQQTRRLSADGNEMIVESIVNVQHGYSAREAKTYGSSRDVFVRVRP